MTNGPPFHNPFGALRAIRDTLPERPDAINPSEEPTPPAADVAPAARVARAVVRLERAGRGGKEATVIEHLSLSATELAAWLKGLKSALGCGGSVEGNALVLQGDQRKRVAPLLAARGVKRVTVA